MLSIIRNRLVPPPEVRWKRADVEMVDVEVDQFNTEVIPLFESGVKEDELRESKLIFDKESNKDTKTVVGTRYWHDVQTENGIDRGVTVYVPSAEKSSDMPFSIAIDTPLMTGLEGHNDGLIASALMEELGVSIILVGPEYTAKNPNFSGTPKKLGEIASKSFAASQSSSAQDSAHIIEHFITSYKRKYNLHNDVVSVGESRAANIEQARLLYLKMLGIKTLYTEATDPCISKHALEDCKSTKDLALWLPQEMIGVIGVGAALALNGDLTKEVGTVPLEKRYLLGATLGTIPYLLNGEEGSFYRRVPRDSAVHFVGFASNPIAHSKLREEKYIGDGHTNKAFVELRGGHFGLAYPSVREHVIRRIRGLASELSTPSYPEVNWSNVHMRDDGRVFNLLTENEKKAS